MISKKIISTILFYFIIWIIVFQLARLLFFAVNHSFLQQGWVLNVLQSAWHGLRMDIAFASYITTVFSILLLLVVAIKNTITNILINVYSFLVVLFVSIIITVDLFTYQHWGYRLDATPIKYLKNPKEMGASMAHLPIFFIVLFLISGALVLFIIIKKIVLNPLRKDVNVKFSIAQKIKNCLVVLIIAALLIIPARGGVQQIPINASSVYFSNNIFYNHAAINVCWNFVNAVFDIKKVLKNDFIVMPENEATQIKNKLLPATVDSTNTNILLTKNNKPNIIFIVWESFTEKATHAQLDSVEITPNFNTHKKEGIYFSNIYAAGDRTDKGIVAILSGYPSQPTTSIIKIPQKVSSLPNIGSILYKQQYNTAFYYGGELDFANIKAYVMGCNFTNITTIQQFKKGDLNSKWGAHDGVVANKILTDIKQQKSPFFYTWLTLSSHEPFETPVASITAKKDNESLFLNSLHYADEVIFNFIDEMKSLPTWQNTIVVIVADHGHKMPMTKNKIDDYKIPILMLGGALNTVDTVINRVGSQIDLPKTILSQLQMPNEQFIWSKNLLNYQTEQWAYSSFNNGFGFVQPTGYVLYDNVGKQLIESGGTNITDNVKKGAAFQQLTFQDFLNR